MRLFVVLLLVASAVTVNADMTTNIFGTLYNMIKTVADFFLTDDIEVITEKPWFCHDLECPEFKKIGNMTEETVGFEERCYPNTTWVMTTTKIPVTTTKMRFTPLFNKLHMYYKGLNDNKTVINMTTPMLVWSKMVEGSTTMLEVRMHFFVPPKMVTRLPKPTRDDIKVINYGPTCVYVHSFDGYIWQIGTKLMEKQRELEVALVKEGKLHDTTMNYFAMYDSPVRHFNRHNEVWMLTTKPTE